MTSVEIDACEDCPFCLGRAAGDAGSPLDNPNEQAIPDEPNEISDHELWRLGYSLGKNEGSDGPWYTQRRFYDSDEKFEEVQQKMNGAGGVSN